MKKVFIVLTICLSVCLSLVACGNQSQQIKLSASNADKYLNVQLIFGDVVDSSSCICYVVVTPKSNCSFTNAEITLNITDGTFSTCNWSPKSYSPYTALQDSAKYTIPLDKNGYGVTSVYFQKITYPYLIQNGGVHPLTATEWNTKIELASGYITEN